MKKADRITELELTVDDLQRQIDQMQQHISALIRSINKPTEVVREPWTSPYVVQPTVNPNTPWPFPTWKPLEVTCGDLDGRN
jgi:hypothetical protein